MIFATNLKIFPILCLYTAKIFMLHDDYKKKKTHIIISAKKSDRMISFILGSLFGGRSVSAPVIRYSSKGEIYA